ncbi:MAG: FAD-dependent monooxygenase [Chloroflexi bacterium]|nr:FAD-dependent monooxygenase [Chloroflexota bacterium]
MARERSEYDVIVVGGRIAGSILACLLGDRGHRVLVLDRATFPSDTLSTHFFRAPALRAFDQIGVYNEVQSVAPHLTVNYNVIDGIAFPEPVDRPEDFPFYMCVRRITLDDILVRRVKSTPNVELREGAKAHSLLSDHGRISGVAWKVSGQEQQAHAKVVVGADGVRSFVAKQVGAKTEQNEPVHRAMYYAYFRGLEANEGPAAEFHYRENNLAYCMPCDDDLTMLAVSVPVDRFGEFKRDPERSLLNELDTMTALAPRLADGKREGPVRGSGSIPCYLRIPYGEGWTLVGDASMALDPWSGQGIDQASTHAVFLAQRIADYLEGQSDWEAAMQAYHQERNEFSKKVYRRTSKFSADLRPMTRAALAKRGLG